MPYPAEYQRATDHFSKFLTDTKLVSMVGSVHQAYTMAQGVFQVFRRRVSMEESLLFMQSLNVGLRALYSSEWNPNEKRKQWESLEIMNLEVKELRPKHNFSTPTAIQDVSTSLRMNVEIELFENTLNKLSHDARLFWSHYKK
ncbi:MAG: DUF2267 domain-containing protein [Leptospira sp.]|nr:DUF2267 domain-containing protein [Leptospira sp.]